MGFRSQLVVAVTGGFTGAVMAAQTYFQFHRLGMDSAVGAVVSVSMFRELGPVLTGLMVAGRVGAAIAAEIGTMKVTEQIDALRALGVSPVDYLVVPRAMAILVSMPLLVAESVGLALIASQFVGTTLLGIPYAYYTHQVVLYTQGRDIVMALSKGFCLRGDHRLRCLPPGSQHQGRSRRRGRAPTEAVVISSLAILIVNFFLTFALNMLFPGGV